MNVPYGITAESSVLPGKPLPEQEQCFYCGFWYPKPVSYHHSSSECREHGDREMNDHKDAVRISKQPEGTYDHRAVLNLKARYLEVVAQLEAERKLNNDLALGNLKAQHAGSLLIRDLREQLEALQRARLTNVSDVMRENEALRKAQDYAQDYAYKIAYLLRHFDYPEFTFPDGETWEAAMKETGK